ncbi:MAG: hypothetical protein H6581_14450 [Bacteroidia bacterium]|nr:hypothetical protein [Bacteroidia bacterium]
MLLSKEELKRLFPDPIYLIPGEQTGVLEKEKPVQEAKESVKEPEVLPVLAEKQPESLSMQEKAPDSVAPALTPGTIKWGLKPESKVILILTQAERNDKELTGLLKAIVESLGIPTEQVGFGFIQGDDISAPLQEIPGKFGIVFGKHFNMPEESGNPAQFNGIPVFFSYSLQELSQNRAYKLELWEYFKSIKSQI